MDLNLVYFEHKLRLRFELGLNTRRIGYIIYSYTAGLVSFVFLRNLSASLSEGDGTGVAFMHPLNRNLWRCATLLD